MQLYVQYPDLTEVSGISVSSTGDWGPENQARCDSIKTPFAFATVPRGYDSPQNLANLIKNGFEPITTMRNWWTGHAHETKPITLWWKRVPLKKFLPQPANRVSWGGTHQAKYKDEWDSREFHLMNQVRSGCCMLLSTPPLKRKWQWRYFCLLRIPQGEMNRVRRKWLEDSNFRFIDEGVLASYWVNGWGHKTYDWNIVEKPYWVEKGVSLDSYTVLTEKGWKLPQPKDGHIINVRLGL